MHSIDRCYSLLEVLNVAPGPRLCIHCLRTWDRPTDDCPDLAGGIIQETGAVEPDQLAGGLELVRYRTDVNVALSFMAPVAQRTMVGAPRTDPGTSSLLAVRCWRAQQSCGSCSVRRSAAAVTPAPPSWLPVVRGASCSKIIKHMPLRREQQHAWCGQMAAMVTHVAVLAELCRHLRG